MRCIAARFPPVALGCGRVAGQSCDWGHKDAPITYLAPILLHQSSPGDLGCQRSSVSHMTYVDTLLGAAGRDWTGTHLFRLMPADPAAESAATAAVTGHAGGNLATFDYTWAHPDDGPQTGVIVVGRGETDSEVAVLWADTWHQGTATTFTGSVSGDTVRCHYVYAEVWRWEIELTVAVDALTLTMRNVVPEEGADGAAPGPYDAMVMRLGTS